MNIPRSNFLPLKPLVPLPTKKRTPFSTSYSLKVPAKPLPKKPLIPSNQVPDKPEIPYRTSYRPLTGYTITSTVGDPPTVVPVISSQPMVTFENDYPVVTFGYQTPIVTFSSDYSSTPQLQEYIWTKRSLQANQWSELSYGAAGMIVATGLNSYSYSTDNGNTWSAPSVINTDSGNEFFLSIAYGNNMWSTVEYVAAVGREGSRFFYTSVDVLTGWTKIPFTNTTLNPLFSSFNYWDMFFNPYNNKFIVFTDQRNLTGNDCNACVVHSSDGVTWLSGGYFKQNGDRITAPNGFGHGVIGTNMPNNRVVACGSAGEHKFGYSNDGGTTWIQGNYAPGPQGHYLQAGFGSLQLAYGYDNNQYLPANGRYVVPNAFGSGGTYQFAYSDDGIGWVGLSAQNTSPLKKDWTGIVYGNNRFIAVSKDARYQALSRDGINWTVHESQPSLSGVLTDILTTNNRVVAIMSNETTGNSIRTAEFF